MPRTASRVTLTRLTLDFVMAVDTKLPYSFSLIGPLKSYVLRFATEQEKHQWYSQLSSAVQRAIADDPKSDLVSRIGTYAFPNAGGYDGPPRLYLPRYILTQTHLILIAIIESLVSIRVNGFEARYLIMIENVSTCISSLWLMVESYLRWTLDQIHGYGEFTFFNNKYSGEWENNVKSGMGSFECLTGETYIGQWANDRPHGIGTFRYHNGDLYEGAWKDGLRDGRVRCPLSYIESIVVIILTHTSLPSIRESIGL